MIPITEIAKGIFKIGPLETGLQTPATSPHLVVGQRAAILEPGEGGQTPELLEGIRQIGVNLDRIDYLIPSHIHLHHCQGVPVLLQEIPQAKVVVHQRAVPHLMEPTRLNESTTEVWGEGCPIIAPVPQDSIWGVVGGEVISLGDRELEIIEATGHARHHIAIFDRLTRALFPGDAAGVLGLGRERGSPDIRPPLFEVDKHIDTLHRLRAFNPSVLFTFGGVSHSPDKTLQWAEDDVLAIERICREGMKQKMSGDEIGRRVGEYYDQVRPSTQQEGAESSQAWAPYGMLAYLKRQDPSLEMPKRAPGPLVR